MNKNVSIIICGFHRHHAVNMLDEVRENAKNNHMSIINETWVPGAMEVPLALSRELSQVNIDGAIVLGIIEKGETKHGLVMANAVMGGVIQLQLEYMKPVGVGILGPEIHPSQIPGRVRPYALAASEALYTMLTR
ncbi:6,7-dimethyl-8-ribityllumazine synthase [Vibrio genomosp. F10]|uniref:6,7-dimethyl-8-ribityllumazine synthase n=1 Tax=Vibrio genomosp. F10 TaxID=723171 RepID=A0A1B9QUT3_9VIBR|nr:6,7-dimethyl-8-ribityllumazine synthase [Vibrio genomosp. F10]OCH71742.1 riboflavin synthase subunit alpha [Vibrio genomosp. F10]OEF05711.1 riboflavin synthase subunit alpha [Vibrio genomosp. F10 str. 9ZD137]OEF07793.1 riboflavin synthase subunit alpha [Vibrio genomosp. F10 str. 9ZB36]